ncbi:MAG: hypothetical protein AUJ72_03695 [Candidatus Omnitrophica bacterium CG1_02_46_14]|nr:MAG: hypothetical protein AUJ72_03695 [Candidatus Omnitrophica bacterium CG1_02_46_14]
MALTPSGTPEVTLDKLTQLKQNGLARLAVSLDASNAESHDKFRQVAGSFQWTLKIIQWANEIGLPVQINTTMTKHNLEDVDAIVTLLQSLNIVLWSVFFLVPVGRGAVETEISAADYEKVFHNYSQLKGKCGACEYKSICGGSRARAFAISGDPMESDPFCIHVPKRYAISESEKRFW